ncbi:MAG: helix-turn-helix domain-containing protein [Tannerella sp.]|jgi:DNA-binding XRE family transcriptional regulator|nr:helix-turn-helix domain-containing protein [Tannerella sp.]
MKERINQLMKEVGFTSSKFAEEIGIQRAAMSHIMSGRNNPSLDVVMKIIERFPDVNPYWLMFGNDEMKQSAKSQPSLNMTTNSGKAPDLFANTAGIRPEEKIMPVYRKEFEDKRAEITPKQPVYEPVKPIKEVPQRKIDKILIFYSDNTFESFNPEKKGL